MKTVKRRRHQRKTDYKKRIALLKSEKPRIVVRKTNKYILSQYKNFKYIKYEPSEEEIDVVFSLSRRAKSKRK